MRLAQNIHSDIKRDKLDIILIILDVANEPVRKTHILYSAGINYYQLTRYLDLLLKAKMIEQVDEPHPAFRTTEKGRLLLKLFSEGFDEEASKLGSGQRTDNLDNTPSG